MRKSTKTPSCLQNDLPERDTSEVRKKKKQMQFPVRKSSTKRQYKSPSRGTSFFFSSLILQNPKLLPLATAIPHAALAAVSLAVEGVFGFLLFRSVEEKAAAAQGFGVVEEDVGFVLVHFAEDDDVGWVVLRNWLACYH